MNGRALFMLAAGFLVWASGFVALYAMLSVGCRFGWHEIGLPGGLSLQRAQLVAIFLLHLAAAATLAVALRAGGTTAPFLPRAAFLSALAALGSTLLTFAPVLVLSTCV